MDENSQYEVFKKIIRRSSKVMFSYDVDSGAITFLNNSFSYLWQRTKESAIANPALIFDTVHPDDRAYLLEEYRELLAGVLKGDVEFRILLPDNSTKWLLLHPQLVTDGQGKRYIAGLVDDISVSKENINTLQSFGAKKNAVLEILSHDLAGPLASIQGLADVLSDHMKDYQNKDVENVIRIIRQSSERSIRLIRDFVKQEFLESSKVNLFKRRVDVVRKVREVVEQYMESESHIQKQIRFTSSSEKVFAYIDDTKFMQVINNLFSNAIKFTLDNGVISLDLTERESTVLITIRDNGIGIPKQYHDRLFERFSPARREGLRGEPSTGLGMSIIRTIVEWHNGSIRFESEENAGTTFYIEIPKE